MKNQIYIHRYEMSRWRLTAAVLSAVPLGLLSKIMLSKYTKYKI